MNTKTEYRTSSHQNTGKIWNGQKPERNNRSGNARNQAPVFAKKQLEETIDHEMHT